GIDGDAVALHDGRPIVRDDVPRSGADPANRVERPVRDPDAVGLVGQGAGSGCVPPDEVADDGVVYGVVLEAEPDGIAGDHIASGGGRSTDRVAALAADLHAERVSDCRSPG